jgi:hypothetical protein
MQGSLEKGMLKWSLEIVRQCDMFWMGVTSKSGLDMSTMIARDPQVWMISEEGTCIEHCRGASLPFCFSWPLIIRLCEFHVQVCFYVLTAGCVQRTR